MSDETKRLIRARAEKSARFRRDGYGKKPQISDSWRRPRGLHNKQRRQKKAKGAQPTAGYGSPVQVRSMHPSGYLEIRVFSPGEISGIDPAVHAIRIGGSVGRRKRAIIIEKATSAGLKILNPGRKQAPGTPEEVSSE